MPKKTNLECVQEFAQTVLSIAPAIILGSGASAAHGVPGMADLARHLRTLPADESWSLDEQREWANFCTELDAGTDLEAALHRVRLSERQTQQVVYETRRILMRADIQVFEGLLADRNLLPLTRLYRHIFNSTHRVVNVVTTNYDRLAEYAADVGGYCHFTGFDYGHIQSRSRHAETRIFFGSDVGRTVCVWKVHGSLDWFRDSADQILAARSCVDVPDRHRPVMVTPGIDKYRLTHGEPFRTIFVRSDSALLDARAYLCVGYGFNDEHVQPKLIERCQTVDVPLLVLTKELSRTTIDFLRSGRCRKFLALDESPTGTRVLGSDFDGSIDLPDQQIWRLDKFLECVLGV
ncbi:SIR2 family protein [Thauera propionica]|uniref:SIR2 family protein n=1 Tax=Thauera propionica TaxID=2019431 RepID=UPI0023F24B7A|nr:SIR2 family protein [Thauera propionica]MDD3675983.1 SIR2 family protein [Thauera propionica]